MACQVMLRPQTYNEVRAATQVVVCDSCQRILYYDPSHDKPAEAVVVPKRRRPRPKFESSQAWYYHASHEGHGEVFLVFINAQGQSSRRIYDAATGRQIGDILLREGDYRLGFPEDLTDTIRLNGSWEESEIDEWGAELPMVVLDVLQRDLDLARAESGPRTSTQREAVPTEHPAAS
jgi:hypothetical protein